MEVIAKYLKNATSQDRRWFGYTSAALAVVLLSGKVLYLTPIRPRFTPSLDLGTIIPANSWVLKQHTHGRLLLKVSLSRVYPSCLSNLAT